MGTSFITILFIGVIHVRGNQNAARVSQIDCRDRSGGVDRRADLLAAQRSDNEAINIACIGVGGKGSSDTDHAGNHGNVVALCDIDDKTWESSRPNFRRARKV